MVYKKLVICFHKILLRWKEKLFGRNNVRYSEQNKFKQSNFFDDQDFLDHHNEENTDSTKLHKRKYKRNILNKIMFHIHSNGHIYCCDCGAKIEGSYLKIFPTATRCVDCRAKIKDYISVKDCD
jgi:RNA polymerase-binding transcription factor DksA